MINLLAMLGLMLLTVETITAQPQEKRRIPPVAVKSATGTAAATTGNAVQTAGVVVLSTGTGANIVGTGASTATAQLELSTSTLDFSGVDEKDKPVVSGYIGAIFDYISGKLQATDIKSPDERKGLITLSDRQQLTAVRIILATVPESVWKSEAYFAYPAVFASSLLFNSWFDYCRVELGNEGCVNKKILPAFKTEKNGKLREHFLAAIIDARVDTNLKERRLFTKETENAIADTVLPVIHDSKEPYYLRAQAGDVWVESENRWKVLESNLKFFMENEPALFSRVCGYGIPKGFLQNEQLNEMMFKILEHPHKYPADVLEGAYLFFLGGETPKVRDIVHRTRFKKTLKDENVIRILPAQSRHWNAHGLLLEIERDEREGKYK